MPLGVKPICTTCKTTNTTMWRKGSQGEVLCNACGLKQQQNGSNNESDKCSNKSNSSSLNGSSYHRDLHIPQRKSSRIKPMPRPRGTSAAKWSSKGKSRRMIFKRNPIKSPSSVSTVVTSDWVFYQGCYFQVGDIVSLLDHDGGIYYAQIRGFMQDQFLEKSAIITWLLPTEATCGDRFDPATYILGPEEDLPRKLEFMEFVCHAPSEYFKAKLGPFPTIPNQPELCYIWTTFGSCIRTIPTKDEIFGPCSKEDLLLDSDSSYHGGATSRSLSGGNVGRPRKPRERKISVTAKDKDVEEIMEF
ncbi:GATA zinc finger domain-containing protein 1-like [Tubulanus polymorphus]|uniref:GATA zinc finger domain-containing protein 1-like n=1 Tax=Tubulanus polymorphus TaxID=672921 RepID=UPI003DA49160